ncbi:MAG: hypothetical protein HUJ26_07380 [Planctomycetaceae bacterium]|nr:hypothetical protein [Planctomycetaceae bacterium]
MSEAESYRQRIDAKFRKEAMREKLFDAILGPPSSKTEVSTSRSKESNWTRNYSDDVKREVINGVLNEILNGEAMQNSRKFYGQPGSNVVALLTDDEFKLPVPLRVHVPGWKIQLRTSDYEPDDSAPRMLLVRFEEFNLDKELGNTLFNAHVEVLLTNGGGSPDGEIHIGGILIFFYVKKTNGKYEALFAGAIDP